MQGGSQAAFDEAVARALACWKDTPDTWRRLQRNGMQRDFGWPASARAYVRAYTGILPGADADPQGAPALSYKAGTAAAEY